MTLLARYLFGHIHPGRLRKEMRFLALALFLASLLCLLIGGAIYVLSAQNRI